MVGIAWPEEAGSRSDVRHGGASCWKLSTIKEHEKAGCSGYRLRTIKEEDHLISAEGGPSWLYGGLGAGEHRKEIRKAVACCTSDDNLVSASKLTWSPARRRGGPSP
jgi:hypothetical protein